jgi:lipid-A-disaccharide synthase
MGFNIIPALPHFMSLISQADRYFRHHRPDAVVMIDNPGFNWWIARRAHYHGIPVFYFVPPQIWAWASWRVSRMKRWVDHVLCSLPFEEQWYRERGVAAEFVGHPFFDELPRQQLDPQFMEEQRQQGGAIVGLLPGSRTGEVERNFESHLRTAQIIHRERPDTRFLVACFKDSHLKLCEKMRRDYPALPLQMFVGKTPEIIEASKTILAVSGSVSLELLYRAKPTVIVFRIPTLTAALLKLLVKTKYITLVNLLADKLIYPEHPCITCQSDIVSKQILHWLNDEQAFENVRSELIALRDRCAQPGACDRAAQRIVEVLTSAKSRAA